MTLPPLFFVVSSPGTAEAFLNPHIERLAQSFEVHVVANLGSQKHQISNAANVIDIPIRRVVDPISDIRCMFQLHRALRSSRCVVSVSVTPKAGLLTALATIGLSVPVRIHWFTGQVWATRKGLKRSLLRAIDAFIARRSTSVLVDSASQLEFLVENRVVTREMARVLGDGSICGVDSERFRPDVARRRLVRESLDVPDHSLIVMFLGRLTEEKGVLELARAFRVVSGSYADARLIFVGPDEGNLEPEIRRCAGSAEALVRFVPQTSAPESFLAAADILCLPSHREGFGLSAIEAGACGVPVVGTNIYGLSDAVEDGATGLLVSLGNVDQLAHAILRLASDAALREQMGAASRLRVIQQFNAATLTSQFEELLRGLLAPVRSS